MADSQTSSVFDEVNAPKKHNWKALALVSYVGLALLFILLFGMTGVAIMVSDNFQKSLILVISESLVALFTILMPTLGIILRGKIGWLFCLSCFYTTLGFSVVQVKAEYYIFASTILSISMVAIILMNLKELLAFFSVTTEVKRLNLHALLIGMAMNAIMFFTYKVQS